MGTKEEEKSVDTQKLLVVSIIVAVALFVVVLFLLIYFMYKDSLTLKFVFDGTKYKISETKFEADGKKYSLGSITIANNNQKEKKPVSLMVTEGNSTLLYFSIKSVAELQGYQYTLGEALEDTQDTRKCHIEQPAGGESVSFVTDSKEVYKIVRNGVDGNTQNFDEKGTQYESYELTDPVIMVDGELYTSAQGIQFAFNSQVAFDESSNQIIMNSLNKLIEITSPAVSNAGYTPSTVFKNQRAIYNGIAVVTQNNQTSSEPKYGLFSIETNANITDAKYDTIEYLQNIDKYIVSSNGNYGILEIVEENNKRITKESMQLEYESITLMDAKKMLFLVEKLQMYGVAKVDGSILIAPEYTSIGLSDVSAYAKQGVKSQYIILDSIIPVQKNGKFGLYDLEGHNLSNELRFAGFGCADLRTVADRTAEPVLILPESAGLGFKGMVAQSTAGKYGLMASTGALKTPLIYDAVYLSRKDGVVTYYAIKDGDATLLQDVIPR